jgi:hypothetical protein
MKKLLIILSVLFLLNTNINAKDINENNSNNWSISGEFKDRIFNIKKEKQNRENYDETGNYASIELKIKYKKGNFAFNAVPYAYKSITESGKKCHNSNFYKPFDSEDFFFRGLYTTYKFTPNFLAGFGIVPMGNGFPMEYTKDYISDGVGLSIMSDIDPLGLFFNYKINQEHSIFLSISQIDTMGIPSGTYVVEQIEDKTKGFAIVHKFKKDKIKTTAQYVYTDVYYTDIKISTTSAFGFGIAYDDSEDSGWTIYDTVGYSLIQNNSSKAKDLLMKDGNIPAGTDLAFPNNFNWGTGQTQTGAANLLGIRKDFETFGTDSFLNFEWFHTEGDWISSNVGAPYTGNCNQIYNIRNNSYFFNYGYRLGKNMFMQVNYTYLEFDEAQQIGGMGTTIPQNDFIGVQKVNSEITKLVFSYKF